MTLRIAVAQIQSKKADYAENLRRIGGVLADLSGWEQVPELVVFPETVMSGFFLEAGVRECAVSVGSLCDDLAAMHAAVGAPPLEVVVGFYEEYQNRYFNSAVYVTLSDAQPLVRHVHRKVFLPTYGPFDEKRFINHGRSVQAFDTGWGRAAVLICEDAWHSITGSLAALDGAQIVIVPSAAPARGIEPAPDTGGRTDRSRPSSVRAWERMCRRIADEHGLFVVLAQPVGFEGGRAMQGGSTIVGPDGEVLVSGPALESALVVADVDLDSITRVRAEQPTLADLENQLLNLLNPTGGESDPVQWGGGAEVRGIPDAPMPAGYTVVENSNSSDPLAIDSELTTRWLEAFVAEEVLHRRGFTKAILGLSGGVDSSLAATLAARALGPENVIGVRMPYKTSSADSLEHAEIVGEQLGIRLETVDITAAVDAYLVAAGDTADETRRGNVMARMRMITLFDLSAKYDALPLGSGNKTERLFGYFTWHGDDSPPVNPLGDLYKTQVLELARHLGIPDEIVSKPPSADLIRGQTDEGDLGISYSQADRILHWLLIGLRLDQIVALGFDIGEVELVSGRLNSTHWKRRLPTVAMVSRTAIGESYLRPVDY